MLLVLEMRNSVALLVADFLLRAGDTLSPLDLVRLSALMERSQGRREIMIALIDGPVALSHPDLAGATIREIPGKLKGASTRPATMSCAHGALVAVLLCPPPGS